MHRTFLEFLTAAEYVTRFKDERTMSEDELLALYDTHCRDEDWREVLRLIAGQINEQIVGQIVKRLAARTDLGKWDGATPLPELPLAIYCLSEVRNLSQLETAAQGITDLLVKGIVGFGFDRKFAEFWFEDVVSACQEVCGRWPARDRLRLDPNEEYSPDYLWKFFHHPWVDVLAAIDPDRELLTGLASAKREFVRMSALAHIARLWPDESTRELVRARAVQDESEEVRGAALQALASSRPDESTRELLRARAVQDKDVRPRSAALQALASTWPDESTRELLRDRAVQEENVLARGAACSALGQMHSEFGRILPTRDMNGTSPYLDPRQPISREHIERAAERVGIAANDLDATLADLCRHLGWDVTRGLDADQRLVS